MCRAQSRRVTCLLLLNFSSLPRCSIGPHDPAVNVLPSTVREHAIAASLDALGGKSQDVRRLTSAPRCARRRRSPQPGLDRDAAFERARHRRLLSDLEAAAALLLVEPIETDRA